MSKTIQIISSENFNAPTLDNTQGNLLNVLSACLVDGLSLPNISAFVINQNQKNETISTTIQFSADHQLKLLQYIELSGFEPAILNGRHRIIGVPTVGSIVIKNTTQAEQIGAALLAPLGFEKLFSASGKAVFRNKNPLAIHRPCLRVDDSLDPVYSAAYAKYAKVGVLSDCADIDDLSTQVIPLDAEGVAKNWVGTGNGDAVVNGWSRWYYARASIANQSGFDKATPVSGARPWVLVGNEDAFYVVNPLTPTVSDTHKIIYGFGVLDHPQIETPYFLLTTLHSSTIATNIVMTSAATPLNNNNSPALIADGAAHATAVKTDAAYTSGLVNTYSNPFVVDAYTLMSNSFIVGVLPILHRILNVRTDPQFSTVIYDDVGYLIDMFVLRQRVAFDLREVDADL